MSGKMYLPLTNEMKIEFIEEAKQQVGSPEGTEFNEKVKELIQNHIDEKMKIIPQLRDKGFTLKRSDAHIRGYPTEMVDSTGSRVVYSDTPKVWKMLLGRK